MENVPKGPANKVFLKYGGKVSNGTGNVRGEILQIVLKKVGELFIYCKGKVEVQYNEKAAINAKEYVKNASKYQYKC